MSYLICLLAAWITASQVWLRALIAETRKSIEVSGIDAYPQLTFIFIAWLLVFWLNRYFNSGFTKFILSAVVFLLFATATPVWFDVASESFAPLSPQIQKWTGVNDYSGQSSLIQGLSFNHVAADIFVVSMILGLASVLIIIWTARPGKTKQKFSTRIDNLPSW